MSLEQWLIAHILALVPVVIGLAFSFSGVQLIKSARLSLGHAPLDNFARRRMAFYFGALGAGMAWGELFEYSRTALWVGLATGFVSPMAWAVIMAWLETRFPSLYQALTVGQAQPAPDDKKIDMTWWGRR